MRVLYAKVDFIVLQYTSVNTLISESWESLSGLFIVYLSFLASGCILSCWIEQKRHRHNCAATRGWMTFFFPFIGLSVQNSEALFITTSMSLWNRTTMWWMFNPPPFRVLFSHLLFIYDVCYINELCLFVLSILKKHFAKNYYYRCIYCNVNHPFLLYLCTFFLWGLLFLYFVHVLDPIINCKKEKSTFLDLLGESEFHLRIWRKWIWGA